MGNTCNKVQNIPSYDMVNPQTNQIPLPQTNLTPSFNTKFRTLAQKSDLIKSRIKNLKKTKGFSQCQIAPKESSFGTKFNAEIIKQVQSSQVLTIKLAYIDNSITKKFSRFFIQMKCFNQVKTLKVSFEGIIERDLKRFCKNLKYMKSLTSLEIKLTRFADSFFPIITSSIKRLKNLTQLSLHFPSLNIENRFLPCFSRKLRFLTPLKTLKLNIENSIVIQCLSLKKMIENLRKLKLSAIVLNLKDVRCENPKISEFLAVFKHFASSLETLSLNFNLLQGSGGLISDYTNVYRYLKNLKYLSVNFGLEVNRIYLPMTNNTSDIRHQEEIIKAIATGWNLKEQPNINHVKFKFQTGNFSLSDPKSFIDFILKIASSDLRFATDITYNYTKNIQFASHFFLGAQKNSLPKLSVTCNMKDDNIQEISDFIAFLKPIQHLYSFRLGFNWDDSKYQINENSIHFLFKKIKQLPSVTGFNLNLKKCFRIDEGLFKKFSSYLLDLQAVDDLNLDFSGCIQISDDCLVYLGDTMMQMKNLKRLSLIFDECYLIRNGGIKALAARLLTIKSLQSVKINCDECFKIYPGEKGMLFHLIQSIPNSEIRLNKILINNLSL